MHPPLNLYLFGPNQPQVHFMHQRRGIEGVIGLFVVQTGVGQLLELRIDQR